MRTEQWIRTQKRRVQKKYIKAGSMYFSPKEWRDFRHGKPFNTLAKAVNKINKGFQELTKGFQKLTPALSEAVKVFSEAYKEEEQ